MKMVEKNFPKGFLWGGAIAQIWQEIVPPTVLAWEYADTTLENQTFSFEQVQEVRFLRMKVHDANLKWKHFAISELEVYNRQS